MRATASADLSDDDLDNFVAIRKQRQRILTREENPVSFHAVVHEAALSEHLGAPAVMSTQAEYLRGLCDLPNVTVQLLPMAAGAHPALTGAFTVLSMSHLDFAHVELMTSDVYVEDPAAVQRYRDAFEALSQRALPPETSTTAIADKIGTTAESTPETAR